MVTGDAPSLDMDFELRLQRFVLAAIRQGIVRSAHDTAEGGIAIALAECCFGDREHQIGARINLQGDVRKDALYFGESQSRVIFSVAPTNKPELTKLATEHNIPLTVIGLVAGNALIINEDINLPVAEMADLFYESVGQAMA